MKRKSMSDGKEGKKNQPSLLPSRCFLSINLAKQNVAHEIKTFEMNPNEIENVKENDNEQQKNDCTSKSTIDMRLNLACDYSITIFVCKYTAAHSIGYEKCNTLKKCALYLEYIEIQWMPSPLPPSPPPPLPLSSGWLVLVAWLKQLYNTPYVIKMLVTSGHSHSTARNSYFHLRRLKIHETMPPNCTKMGTRTNESTDNKKKNTSTTTEFQFSLNI